MIEKHIYGSRIDLMVGVLKELDAADLPARAFWGDDMHDAYEQVIATYNRWRLNTTRLIDTKRPVGDPLREDPGGDEIKEVKPIVQQRWGYEDNDEIEHDRTRALDRLEVECRKRLAEP